MKRWDVWALFGVLIVLGAALAGIGKWYGGRSSAGDSDTAPRVSMLGRAPNYMLIDQLSHKVSSRAFRGKVQIVTFLFPYCREYCPLIARHLVSLEKSLAAAGLLDRVQIISFNVDPENTGPATLRAFMREYGWNPEDTHWEYLTGSPGAIRKVVRGGYFINYQRVSLAFERREEARARETGHYTPGRMVPNPLADRIHPNYDVEHNDVLDVVGPRGRIRAIYPAAETVSSRKLMRLIHELL